MSTGESPDMRVTLPMEQYGWVIQEVLEAGPRAGRRASRSPAFWWILGMAFLGVFSVLATSAVMIFGSQTVQAERLFTAVEASERSMGFVQAQVAEVFEQFDAEDLTEAKREQLVDELRDIAAEGEISIASAGERIESVRIWPINTRLEQAREVYLRHNQAWVDYLARASQDPAEFVSPQPEVDSTFFDARIPLLNAIPALDLLDLQERLDRMYADGDDQGGGNGGTEA